MTLTPEQIADGWIAHDGKECPVGGRTRPRILFASGEPSGSGAITADEWSWRFTGRFRIIAYRPEQPA